MATREAYPTGWPGNYVGDNFDESLRYQIQLEKDGQGIYTPDPNEMHFTNLTRHRRAVEQIIGDKAIGDAFKVVGTGATNDFTITGGDGTIEGALRYFLAGYEVFILSDAVYSTQNALFNDSLGPTVTALTTPGADRVDEVYLDIFLGQVTGVEDSFLIPPSLAQSVSNRLRLIIQVKVSEGGVTPDDFVDGDGIDHHTLRIATLNRLSGITAINNSMVEDNRVESQTGSVATRSSDLETRAQSTPDDTVFVAPGIYLDSAGLKAIQFAGVSTSSFTAATAGNVRYYNVELDDTGTVFIDSFNEVVAPGDFITAMPEIIDGRRAVAVVRVPEGTVEIDSFDVLDIRASGGGGGSGALLFAAYDRFDVALGVPQSVFNLTFSVGSADGLLVVRNGQVLQDEGTAVGNDFEITSPTQITFGDNTGTGGLDIPGTVADEKLMFIPRTTAVQDLVVIEGSDDSVVGDTTTGPYVFSVDDWVDGNELIYVSGVLQDQVDYTKTGISEITFVSLAPTGADSIRVVVRPQVSTTGTSLEALGVVTAGDGPSLRAPNDTVRKLTLTDSDELALDGTIVGIPSGSKMLFQQTAAPTGWTKDATHNDKALRIVNGTVGTGGTNSFTTALGSSVGISGSTDGHAITIPEMPAHTHNTRIDSVSVVGGAPRLINATGDNDDQFEEADVGISTGGGGTHSHTLTGATADIDVEFVDFIIATKD